jgi:hypothetical protein
VGPREFRDHWADTEPKWSHGGTWLTTFVLPPKAVEDTVAAAAGHMDLPFLALVPASGMHITVQGVSRLPDPIEAEMSHLIDDVQEQLADVDAFDAALAEPVVGSGGVYFDVSPQDRFAALRDGVRRGTAGWLVRRAGRSGPLTGSRDSRVGVSRPIADRDLGLCESRRPPGLARPPALGARATTRNSVSIRVVEACAGLSFPESCG